MTTYKKTSTPTTVTIHRETHIVTEVTRYYLTFKNKEYNIIGQEIDNFLDVTMLEELFSQYPQYCHMELKENIVHHIIRINKNLDGTTYSRSYIEYYRNTYPQLFNIDTEHGDSLIEILNENHDDIADNIIKTITNLHSVKTLRLS